MKFILNQNQQVCWTSHCCSAVIGMGGRIPEAEKKEGDGATPIGSFSLRRVYCRADRVAKPQTGLPVRELLPDDGWCDDPSDPAYNRPVCLPYPASAEALFRQDHVYDLLVVLGHNDQPPIAGLGSAIFLHLARKTRTPTRGCVALCEPDLRAILRAASVGSSLVL